jgi:hypothetical protein
MEYKCKICIKIYSSYQSLWIHNKKYHNDVHNDTNQNQSFIQSKTNHKQSNNECIYCNKKVTDHRHYRLLIAASY